ncbi:MAG: HEAT repeat domain-containing protein [Myxococcales bacterium]|nr:HEAT repeat domain-containing protein [Myxococcales bacterium]
MRMLALLQGKGSLPGDRPELYRQGLAALVEHGQADVLATQHVAERLAWVAILGGVEEFGFGVGAGLDLHDFQVQFQPIARADIEAALRTPIFEPIAADQWTFAHRSYAEYLAARFTVNQEVSLGRLRSLMEIEGIVPEPLSGLAAWLAALRPDCADWLVEADPARLLELQAHLPEAQRLQWFEALVSAVRQGRAQLWGHDLRVLLSPAVDERARELLHDAHEEVARAATRLVALADRPGAANGLVEVASTPSVAEGVRIEAVFRLAERSDRSPLAALRPLLDEELPDRLHGQLLEALWPDHLSSAGLILELDPRRRRERNFNLSYFLGQHVAALIDGLGLTELERVLAWTASQPGHLVAERWPFLGALLQRAWDLALEPTIARALGGVFAAWLPSNVDGSDLERWGLDAWEDPSDFRRRRAVVRAILVGLGDERARTRRFWTFSRILPPLDIVLEEAEALREVEPEMARRWCGLAVDYRWSSEHLPRLEALAELLPALREEIDRRRSWEARPLPVPVAREPREPESTIEEQVVELIEAAGHDPMWWVEIAWRLDVLRHRDELDPQLEASTLPVAEAFLAAPPLEEPEWLGDSRLPSAARHAWRLCDPSSLPSDPPVVRFWLAAFLLAGDRSHADEVVVAAVEAFSTEVEAAAELALAHGRGLSWTVFTWLGPWWGPRWSERAQALLARTLPSEPCEEAPSTDDERRRANELRNRRDGLLHDQERLFRALLALPAARDEFWAWGMARLGRDGVVSALFRADTARAWGDLWDRFVEEADTRRLIAFALGDSMELWDVAPHRTTQVIRLLKLDFGDPEPRRNAGPVQPIDRVARLRSALFTRLVASGAVEQVRALVEEFGWHGGNILDAQRARAKSAWQPLSLAEAASFEPRLRTPRDLLDRVLEALDDVEKDLADAGLAEAFLDRSHADGDKSAKPKRETAACSLLADRLGGKLEKLTGLKVHLEPQEDGGRDRIDIKLDTQDERGDALTLKIEVKWVMNRRVETAMETQLVNRYANHFREIAALYLVLWPDPRLNVAKVPATWRDDPASLEALLETKAAELRRRHPCLAARVLRLGQRRSG